MLTHPKAKALRLSDEEAMGMARSLGQTESMQASARTLVQSVMENAERMSGE
jgi:hypothetical protein